MNWLENIFKTSSEKVDALRKGLVELQRLKDSSLRIAAEYKQTVSDWKPCKESIEKGNSSSVLRVLDNKYKDAVKKYEDSLKKLSEEQEICKSNINELIEKNDFLFPLILSSDFLSKNKRDELVVSLVKGHKEGKISSAPLKRLISYQEENLTEKDLVYVRDNRTQYADVIVLNDKNEILFVVRNKQDDFCPGGYCLPGGHIEPDELPKTAAKRELEEETGIDLKESEFTLCGEYIDSKSHIYYFCVKSNLDPVVLQEEEQVQYERVPYDELENKPLIMNLQNNLEHLIEVPKMKLNPLADNAKKLYFDGSQIVKGSKNVTDLLGLENHCALVKANNEIFVYEQPEDTLEKASRAGLIKKKMFITRSGKTFLQTVWIKPDDPKSLEVKKETEVADSLKGADRVIEGDYIFAKTSRGIREGVVEALYKTKEGSYIGFRTPDGKYSEVYLKALKDLKVASTIPEFKEEDKEFVTPESFFEKVQKDGLDFSSLRTLGGSSQTFLCDYEGEKYFLKRERDGRAGQLNAEVWADKLYNSLGFNAPESRIIEIKDKTTGETKQYKVNKYIPYEELDTLSLSAKRKAYEELRKGYVVDCLLANWDVIGASGDNILVSPDGTVYRIDNGSSFEYRAKGSLKPDSSFMSSSSIGELDTMRMAPTAAEATVRVFGSLTKDEIKAQAKELVETKWDKLVQFYDLLKKEKPERARAFMDRCEWLKSYAFKEESKVGEWDEKPKDSSMPSKVTEVYFSDWDSFEIEGNAELKDSLKRGILAMERKMESNYEEGAELHGLTVGAYKKKLQDATDKIFSKLIPEIAVDSGEDVFNKIFTKEGRFKSLFETSKGHGSTSKFLRAEEEFERFGFERNEVKNKVQRPIYGYCTNNSRGAYASYGVKSSGIPPSASFYGDIIIEIDRNKALKSATMTAEDSLGSSSYAVAVPFGKPHFSVWQNPGKEDLLKGLEDFAEGKTKNIPFQGSYLELQYHNQLLKDDVKEIHVNLETTKGVARVSSSINRLIELSSEMGKVWKFDLYSEKK